MKNIESTRTSKAKPSRGAARLAPDPPSVPNLHPLSPDKAREYLDFLQTLFEPVPTTTPSSHGPFGTGFLPASGYSSLQLQERAEARRAAAARIRLRLRDPIRDPDAMPPFITSSTRQPGFPEALAQFLALHCDYSYRKPRFFTDCTSTVLPHFLLRHQRPFNERHAHGLGFVFERHAFLVFRGSQSSADWRHNLKRWRQADQGDKKVRVHCGFQQTLDLLWHDVNEWLAELPPVEGVILSGHSLGGAMAILAAHRLRLADEQVTSVVTFGSPRVGGDGFAESYGAMELDERTWRVVWGGDLVTKLPLLGYRDVGQVVPIGSPRQLEDSPFMDPLVGQSNELWRTLSLLLSARNPWVYAAVYALPYALGLLHSGREHMRSLGYSWVHKAAMDRQFASVLDALKISGDGPSREILAQMHRSYFCGEGVDMPASRPQRDDERVEEMAPLTNPGGGR